jgi:LysR family transcriptional activator of nhaA
MIAYRILQPVLAMPEQVQLICDEDSSERLISELAEFRLDVVLSDTPITSATPVRAFNHLLGACAITLFAAPEVAARYRPRFPAFLDGAPFLLPRQGSTLRRSLDQWMDAENVRPAVIGEFKDSALLKTFGGAGAGIFCAPSAIEKEIRSHYKVAVIGRIDSVTERFYAISVERKLKHPAVVTICNAARDHLFA